MKFVQYVTIFLRGDLINSRNCLPLGVIIQVREPMYAPAESDVISGRINKPSPINSSR